MRQNYRAKNFQWRNENHRIIRIQSWNVEKKSSKSLHREALHSEENVCPGFHSDHYVSA